MSQSAQSTETEHARSLLHQVVEPNVGRSIVDLGLVTAIDSSDDTLGLSLEMLTPMPGMRDSIDKQVRTALAPVIGTRDLDITWSFRVRSSGSGRMDAQPIEGVKNAIAVASGKGGVGKSTVAVNLACSLAAAGATVGLLDADVYGPSIPLMMGISERPLMQENRIIPVEKNGVRLMSVGFILEPDKALIWRGPMVAQLITQFLNDVLWGDLDYLVVDLPPGTGDVQLTLAQKIPISGAVIVTTPQPVALVDAVKGLQMFEEVKTPILGMVENMSGFICPSCGEEHDIFGSGGGERVSEEHGVELLGKIPIEPGVREGGDAGVPVVLGHPDSATGVAFQHAAERVAGALSVSAAQKPRKPTIMMKTVN